MCELGGKVRVPFEPVTIENEKIISTPLFLPFTDLESREDGTLSSFGTTEMTFESLTFDPIGYQCILQDSIETNAMITIKNFRSGPYQTSGFSLNFKRLFFFIKDLIIFVKVRFVYDPNTLCTDVSGNRKIYMIIDNIRGIEYGDFYVTDGLNNESRNPTFLILDYLFKEHSTHFGLFWDSIVNTILQGSEINELIMNEFERTLCEDKRLYGEPEGHGHGGDETEKEQENQQGKDQGTEKDQGSDQQKDQEKQQGSDQVKKSNYFENQRIARNGYQEKIEKIKSMNLYSLLFKSN